MSNKIRLACITDSPKITTGFGNVANVLLHHFHNIGFDVYSLGTMDTKFDNDGKLPFSFWPADIKPDDFNVMYNLFNLFLVNSRPDVIFMLYDPGTLKTYLEVIQKLQKFNLLKQNIPVVVYTPIEGFPIPSSTPEFFEEVLHTGGRVILYSQGSIDLVERQYPQLKGKLDFANHGLDHADFHKYSDKKRSEIRKYSNLDDYFVVGSFGVNKRTKGFDQIIYTARCLKDMGKDRDVKFYLHTSSNKPVLSGYNLVDMVANYDVEDMIIFKPEQEKKAADYVNGIPRESIVDFNDQPSIKNIANLGFIDRLNMLDIYLDLSQVEGWGLPPHEAMRCGVPTISVRDGSIRNEVYDGGVMWLEPLPFRTWNTWHNGVKLVTIDPVNAANAVYEMKMSKQGIRDFWSDVALENANKYNWDEPRNKIADIIMEVI